MITHFNNIPEQLRKTPRWVNFKCVRLPNGRVDKTPISYTGRAASSTDKNTWSSFENCCKALEFGVGNALGFALGKEYNLLCVDLDHAFNDDRTPTPTAKKYLDALKTYEPYIERSISGDGIHIFVWYTGPVPPIHPEPGVELFVDARFVVVTGVPI